MQLYEEWIREWRKLEDQYPFVRLGGQGDPDADEWDLADNQLIMRQDAAVELGGGSCPALSVILYTEDRSWETLPNAFQREDISGASRQEDCGLNPTKSDRIGSPMVEIRQQETPRSEIFLCGPDLGELSGDVPFARVLLAGIKQEFLAEEFKRYQLFRSIEYIRYRVSPYGYMPRISAARNREQVRVSGDAVRSGITFRKVGNIYQKAYCAHPAVAWVKQYFITLKDFDHKSLQSIADGAEAVTMALDHPLNNLRMDCNACNLKAVCDEVDLLCKEKTT